MIAGLAIFGGGYVGSVLSAVASEAVFGKNSAIGSELFIPIAGPWIALGSTDWDKVADNQRTSAQATLFLQGALQATGALISIIGISRYVSSGKPERAVATRDLSFSFGPTPGGGLGTVYGVF